MTECTVNNLFNRFSLREEHEGRTMESRHVVPGQHIPATPAPQAWPAGQQAGPCPSVMVGTAMASAAKVIGTMMVILENSIVANIRGNASKIGKDKEESDSD